MSNTAPNQVPDFKAIGNKLKADSKRYAESFCLQWFEDSFQNGGFTDSSFVAWDARKNDKDAGRAILVQTTYLSKSLEIMQQSVNAMTFGTTVPYAALHNEGGRLRAVQYVRAHTRTNSKGKRMQVQGHSRKMDIKYPKRQFIGHSEKMMQGLDSWLVLEIEKRFKQI
jgi:phage gpG-like protein